VDQVGVVEAGVDTDGDGAEGVGDLRRQPPNRVVLLAEQDAAPFGPPFVAEIADGTIGRSNFSAV
jgi:hypothetical protein